jgi:hypothetical protein
VIIRYTARSEVYGLSTDDIFAVIHCQIYTCHLRKSHQILASLRECHIGYTILLKQIAIRVFVGGRSVFPATARMSYMILGSNAQDIYFANAFKYLSQLRKSVFMRLVFNACHWSSNSQAPKAYDLAAHSTDLAMASSAAVLAQHIVRPK